MARLCCACYPKMPCNNTNCETNPQSAARTLGLSQIVAYTRLLIVYGLVSHSARTDFAFCVITAAGCIRFRGWHQRFSAETTPADVVVLVFIGGAERQSFCGVRTTGGRAVCWGYRYPFSGGGLLSKTYPDVAVFSAVDAAIVA